MFLFQKNVCISLDLQSRYTCLGSHRHPHYAMKMSNIHSLRCSSFTRRSPIFFGFVLCSHIRECLQMLKKIEITEYNLWRHQMGIDLMLVPMFSAILGPRAKVSSHYEIIIEVQGMMYNQCQTLITSKLFSFARIAKKNDAHRLRLCMSHHGDTRLVVGQL